jgi:putative chitinase
MRLDHEVYFANVRDALFQGSMEQIQVDGQNVILALWEYGETGSPMDDLRWLAYMLATTYHETAQRMWPIREIGLGDGHDYGIPDENGNTFYGRGFVQLTWKENYDRASGALGLIDERDLTRHPDVALDSLIAARVMFRGMSEGWFTGAKLGQFFNGDTDDPIEARTIINGHDCDELIAGYHDQFLTALDAAHLATTDA